jgi:hypothetical protein
LKTIQIFLQVVQVALAYSSHESCLNRSCYLIVLQNEVSSKPGGSFCTFNGTALYIGNSALQLIPGDRPHLSGELKIKAKLQDVKNQDFSVSFTPFQ